MNKQIHELKLLKKQVQFLVQGLEDGLKEYTHFVQEIDDSLPSEKATKIAEQVQVVGSFINRLKMVYSTKFNKTMDQFLKQYEV